LRCARYLLGIGLLRSAMISAIGRRGCLYHSGDVGVRSLLTTWSLAWFWFIGFALSGWREESEKKD